MKWSRWKKLRNHYLKGFTDGFNCWLWVIRQGTHYLKNKYDSKLQHAFNTQPLWHAYMCVHMPPFYYNPVHSLTLDHTIDAGSAGRPLLNHCHFMYAPHLLTRNSPEVAYLIQIMNLHSQTKPMNRTELNKTASAFLWTWKYGAITLMSTSISQQYVH